MNGSLPIFPGYWDIMVDDKDRSERDKSLVKANRKRN